MSNENAGERAWEMMEKIGICTFVTRTGTEMHARPMSGTVKRDEHAIYFMTDVSARKDGEVDSNPSVLLMFSDTAHQKYVALTGTASVSNDRAKIKEIWTPFARAWWDSAEDPRIRLVTVRPESAELWDSPGTIGAYAKMIAAAVTGAKLEIGENKTVGL